MDRDLLKQVLIDQRESFFQEFQGLKINRDVSYDNSLSSSEATVITGVRRCGKSSILSIIAREVSKQSPIFYLSFEDVRLNDFNLQDFEVAYRLFLELEDVGDAKCFFFYDELQMIDGWERWISQLLKNPKVKIFITGSNAKMLSTEMATLLTGRHERIELFPLSFKELVAHRSPDLLGKKNNLTSKDRAGLSRALNWYFSNGGFPRVVLDSSNAILKQYFRDIVLRDIVLRKQSREQKYIMELGRVLMTENTNIFNKSRVAKQIGFSNPNNFLSYLCAFEDSFLTFEIKKFDYSVRKQQRSHSKYYSIDTGMARSAGFYFSENYGKALENLVFLELKRRLFEVFYWHTEDDKEVDFLTFKEGKLHGAIQVCASIDDKQTLDREVRSLLQAKKKFNLKQALIITKDQEVEIEGIEVKSFINWSLDL